MKPIVIFISILSLSFSADMHQDRILQIDEVGNITGLPKEYSPAQIDVANERLRIGDKEIVFPNCLGFYFNELNATELKLTASWYHSKDILPYYINFDVPDSGSKLGRNILIDLETLELIKLNKTITEGNKTHIKELELDEECLAEYKSQISTVKTRE